MVGSAGWLVSALTWTQDRLKTYNPAPLWAWSVSRRDLGIQCFGAGPEFSPGASAECRENVSANVIRLGTTRNFGKTGITAP